jgi:hypothetical protein
MRKQTNNIGEVVMQNQRATIYFITFALIIMIINATSAFATERNVNWDTVSENLVSALQSDNPGLQQSAMRLIIQYADKLDMDDAVMEMMVIYRFSDDRKMRQLALVTLHKIGSEYAIDFIKRNLKYEADEKIIKLSNAILNNYNDYASVDESLEIAAR